MPITPATFNPANVTMLSQMEGAVPKAQGQLILQDIMANSLMMQLAQYEEMTTPEKEFDVFLGGLGAYWVGEGQRIETTKPTWAKAVMKAHKLGVILPISREYLSYKQADFFEFMKPYLAEALYKKLDAATILNVDNPYTQSVEQSVTAAGSKVSGGMTVANVDALFAKLNDAGYEPNAIISKTQNATLLRALVRDDNGLKERIYNAEQKQLDGIPVFNMHKDIKDMKKGSLYAGDFNYMRYGIPYSMNYGISTDATLTTLKDKDGNPVNLFEREMVALRVSMDVGFMIIKDDAFASLTAPVQP